jgi:hypothetical protein
MAELARWFCQTSSIMKRGAMEDGRLPDDDPFVTPSRWPARAKDWRQVFLLLAGIAGVVVLYWWATRPNPVKITPAGEQAATKFVNELLVKYDCQAAASLDVNSQSDGIPRANRRCARYVWMSEDLDQGQYLWYLVRGSGAVVPHCGSDSRYDDCVSFQLIQQRTYGFESGHLDVLARPSHGRWLVTSFGIESDAGSRCPHCLALWRKRVNVPLPASAHRLTVTPSKTHGPPGARVVVRVQNCSKPGAGQSAGVVSRWGEHPDYSYVAEQRPRGLRRPPLRRPRPQLLPVLVRAERLRDSQLHRYPLNGCLGECPFARRLVRESRSRACRPRAARRSGRPARPCLGLAAARCTPSSRPIARAVRRSRHRGRCGARRAHGLRGRAP